MLIAAWLALTPAMAAGGGGLISPRSHVLVLTGLPGDSETESAYTQQVGRLLELIARNAVVPKRVTVLADSPQLIRVPQGLEGRVHEATRDGLRELGASLEGEELVALLWGHGGLRGRDPVLHVRGPRIEPADLVALAQGAASSSWLLFFRQSGAFARQLRGPGRLVVSSEADTAFRSDPIGIDLLLDLLRDHSGADVVTLARALGPATVSWYERNHLARTEEPTLWPETGEPIRLAESDEANPLSAETASIDGESGAWREIEPARPEDHPGAPAIVLRREIIYTIGSRPSLASVSEEYLQILTREGEQHARMDVSFSPPEETLHILDLERRAPDGSVERLDPELLVDSRPSVEGDYRVAAHRAGELPGAEPGAIFRLRYRREWKSYPLPHVYFEVPLAEELPVKEMRVEVRADREGPLHWGFRHRDGVAPDTSDGRYGRAYSWTFVDLPERVAETLVAPSRTPALLLSTFPDWREFSDWYRRLIRQADQVTPEISSAARQLTGGATSPRDKVRRLAEFVTGLRYVAIPLGVNSHRPHAAATVLRNRYGDCKDKANLLNTMLATLGIEAHLVLVPRFTQADESIPGLAFNHAISQVRLADEVLWVDTTDETTPFGLLPPGDPGRKVLVIEDGTTELSLLPQPRPSEHGLDLSIEVSLDDEPATGSIELRASGFLDYRLRLAQRLRLETGRNLPLLSAVYRPVAGVFSVADQESSEASRLEIPLTWSGRGAWTAIRAGAPEGWRVVQAPFWLPIEWEQALHARRAPLYLNEGYPFELRQSARFRSSAGLSGALLPAAASSESGPLRWRLTWSHEGESAVAHLQVTLVHADLDEQGTRDFQRELRRLLEALSRGLRAATPTGETS